LRRSVSPFSALRVPRPGARSGLRGGRLPTMSTSAPTRSSTCRS